MGHVLLLMSANDAQMVACLMCEKSDYDMGLTIVVEFVLIGMLCYRMHHFCPTKRLSILANYGV